MKSKSRVVHVNKGLVDQINALPTDGLNLQDPNLRMAFEIHEALDWVLGKHVRSPEDRVRALLEKYRDAQAWVRV